MQQKDNRNLSNLNLSKRATVVVIILAIAFVLCLFLVILPNLDPNRALFATLHKQSKQEIARIAELAPNSGNTYDVRVYYRQGEKSKGSKLTVQQIEFEDIPSCRLELQKDGRKVKLVLGVQEFEQFLQSIGLYEAVQAYCSSSSR